MFVHFACRASMKLLDVYLVHFQPIYAGFSFRLHKLYTFDSVCTSVRVSVGLVRSLVMEYGICMLVALRWRMADWSRDEILAEYSNGSGHLSVIAEQMLYSLAVCVRCSAEFLKRETG